VSGDCIVEITREKILLPHTRSFKPEQKDTVRLNKNCFTPLIAMSHRPNRSFETGSWRPWDSRSWGESAGQTSPRNIYKSLSYQCLRSRHGPWRGRGRQASYLVGSDQNGTPDRRGGLGQVHWLPLKLPSGGGSWFTWNPDANLGLGRSIQLRGSAQWSNSWLTCSGNATLKKRVSPPRSPPVADGERDRIERSRVKVFHRLPEW